MSAIRATRRLLLVLAAVALTSACAAATAPEPSVDTATSPSASPSWSAATAPPPGASPAAWLRLAWEEVQLPPFPRYRYLTNVNTSSRGTLIRYQEHPDSATAGILTTRDGRTWTRASAPFVDAPFGLPVEGGRDWLQVAEPVEDGAPLELLASVDGAAWTLRGRLPVELGRAGMAAVSSHDILVCGLARTAPGSTCAVSGDDGATWSRMSDLDALLRSARPLGLEPTSTGFAVVFRSSIGRDVVATTATSDDGRAWTITPDVPVPGISGEIGGRFGVQGGSLVISGSVRDGEAFVRGLWTSPDGRAWRRVPLPRIVAWSGELMALDEALVSLAVDGSGDATRMVGLLVSGDGVTWRSDSLPTELATTLDWEWRLEALPAGLLAFQEGTGPADVTPRAFLGRPVPVADPGPPPAPLPTALPQPSGSVPPTLAWTVGASYPAARVTDVVAWRQGYLAVGYAVDADGGSVGPAAWTSGDGLAWTQVLDPSAFPGSPSRGAPRMLRVVVSDGVIVAAGDAPGEMDDDVSTPVAAFWRSTDGTTWQRAHHRAEFVLGMPRLSEDASPGLSDLAVGGPGFVAVGTTRADGPVVWTSTDGLDWRRTATLGGSSVQHVGPGRPGMIAIGEDRYWISPDGVEWFASDWPSELRAGRLTIYGGRILTAGFPPSRSDDGLRWEAAPPQPAFERAENEDGLTGIAGAPWGYVGVGRYLCLDSLKPCPAAWTSADGLRWDRTMLPLADRRWAACPSCQLTPVAVAVDGRRVIVVGTTYSPGFESPGWASWVGTVATP